MKPALDQDGSDLKEEGYRQLVTAFLPEAGNPSPAASDGGNPCLLSLHAVAPIASPPPVEGLTCCQSWPASHEDEEVIAVSCYTADGRPIQCCGHGLLAAAHSWQQRLRRGKVTLLMNGSVVPGWRQRDKTWLRFQRLPTTACPVPDWVMDVFPNQPPPLAAAVCGEEQGYLVLQWPDGFPLNSLCQPLACLSELSRRALICTAAQPSVGDAAITLRYFAPQYGVAEDPATGSALRVLAEYWSPRFERLTAWQCSAGGGLLLARWTPDHIDVGGCCRIAQAGKP